MPRKRAAEQQVTRPSVLAALERQQMGEEGPPSGSPSAQAVAEENDRLREIRERCDAASNCDDCLALGWASGHHSISVPSVGA